MKIWDSMKIPEIWEMNIFIFRTLKIDNHNERHES